MRVAIYARVSTSNINGQDPTIETRELHEYSERRGWTVAGEYVDVGISGTKEKRPEQDRLTLNANRCPFDCVVVWKFDRFARSVSHLLRAPESFQSPGHRVRFVVGTDGHVHARQQDGIYRPGCCCRVGPLVDRGAGKRLGCGMRLVVAKHRPRVGRRCRHRIRRCTAPY